MQFLHSLSRWGHRVASWPLALVFLVATVLFNALVFPWLFQKIGVPPGHQLLDLRFGFSPDEAYRLLEALGTPGRTEYLRAELAFDMVYPFCYTGLLVCLLSLSYGRLLGTGHPMRLVNLLPFVVMLADFAENLGIAALLTRFPERMDGLARTVSLCNQVKWGSFALCVLLALAGLAWLLWAKRRR